MSSERVDKISLFNRRFKSVQKRIKDFSVITEFKDIVETIDVLKNELSEIGLDYLYERKYERKLSEMKKEIIIKRGNMDG